jgi:hypothetical protein
MLWLLIALAALYSAALHLLHTLSGRALVDGALGVVLGLFVCSRAAANMVDMLLFERYLLRQRSSRRADLLWIALNLLTLAAGWIAIVAGTTRFTG